MEVTGQLRKQDSRYEFHFEEIGLVVRGEHPEWVLEAAAEIICDTERLRFEGRIDELTVLTECGEADEIDIDDLRYCADERFEKVPQCTVSLGSIDYHWVSKEGRNGLATRRPPVERIHRISLTRPDTSSGT
jgi:hypothetical protein